MKNIFVFNSIVNSKISVSNMSSNIDKQKELWLYVFKLFPVFDIIFGIFCVLFSDNWVVSLFLFLCITITAGLILQLAGKKKFQPGKYIFFFNSINFFLFAYFSGHNSPSWLLFINVCIGSSFMFDNPRVGQILAALFTVLIAAFYYYLGASLLYCYTFSGALLAFIVLFARTHEYLNLQHQKIDFQKKQIEEKNKNITDSINYAKRIQVSILPSENYWKKNLPENFILYRPKDIVSGDFYWMESINDNVLFAAVDCTGHGVSGAMVSLVCSNALNRVVKEFEITEPSKILDKTRQLVIEAFSKNDIDIKDGMDISLCSLNKKTLELLWSGANNPLWYISGSNFNEIKADRQPIGKTDNPKPFTTHTVELQKGDTFYLFTDGYIDQFGGKEGKKLMRKRFKEILLQIQHKTIDEQGKYLSDFIEDWKIGLEQVDDILIIGVRL